MGMLDTQIRTISARLVPVALLTLSLGCVTSGTYDGVVSERDTLRAQNESLEANLQEKTFQMNRLKGTYEGLAAHLEEERESGKVEIEQLRDGIQLSISQDILFASGSTDLGSGGAEVLARVASQIKALQGRVDVVGHTDNIQISPRLRARFPSNWELAGSRASAVVKLLQEEGIEGARLRAISNGPFMPRVSNDSEEGRAMNRRIEIRLYPVRMADG